MKKCVATKFSAAMDEEQSKKNKKKKEVENIRKIAADSLKELVVLEQQNGHQPLRRSGNTVTTNKEAHPRAVLSTKLSTDDSASPPQGIETVPSSSTTPSPQVIRSSNCTVSRQISSPVDLPPSSARARSSIEQRDFEDYLVIDKVQPQSRPANLVLKRESSSTSVSTPRQELCSCLPSPGLVSSYPPGPTVSRVQSCNCSARQPVRSLETEGNSPQQLLAKKIAQRLKEIGDKCNLEAEALTVADIQDQLMSSLGLSNGFSWRSVIQLYRALSALLRDSLANENQDLAHSEVWRRFEELWKLMLQFVVSWIADHGGWIAFLRYTDDNGCIPSSTPSSTPNGGRRHFSFSMEAACQYYTPQTHRRNLCQYQSSPAVCNGCGHSTLSASGGERGSRVYSVTGDGALFELEGIHDDISAPEREIDDETEEGGDDNGIEIHVHSGSQSSMGSEGYSSPDATAPHPPPHPTPPSVSHLQSLSTPATPNQPRPQGGPNSHTPSATAVAAGEEGMQSNTTAFDRNRSMSMPVRHRPRSASIAAANSQRRAGVHSLLEVGELSDSVDSGLATTCSNTSLASQDSLNYSRIGVSAVCIFEAVKSMLDHQ